MANTSIIQINQLFRSFHSIVFFRVIEPSRTNRHVTLRRNPLISISMPVLQFSVVWITGIDFSCPQERPVCNTGKAIFISYPTASRTSIREYNSLWLKLIEHFINLREVIVVFPVDCTRFFGSSIPSVSSIGSIKPNFENFTIICHQIPELCMKIVYIRWTGIISSVPIPW